MRGHVGHLDRVAQVRLVGAVVAHRLRIGDQRKLRRHRLAAAEFLEHAAQHRLDRGEHVLLGDEAHLDVELVELAGRAVGAGVLVAKARRDLEIAVEARHHDELLELLRRLRQRIELAGMNAATAPGSRARPSGLDAVRIGVWNSKKPCSFMRRRSESMMAPRFMMLLCSRSRRRSRKRYLRRISSGYSWSPNTGIGSSAAGPSTSISVANTSTAPVGRSGILGAARALPHQAVDPDHPFRAQLFGGLEGRRIRVGHHLGEAVMVAQVDEQHAAMVADAVTPARKADGGADVARRAARRRCGYDSDASGASRARRRAR